MKRIFVTGAGGFVGARACRFLQGNYEVLTLPKGWMASCTELQLMQSIAEAQPDVILHTAAISDTGYTEQHPEEAYRANVELPLWLARAAAQCGARLVGFSSDQVYAGVQQPGSLPETMELLPCQRLRPSETGNGATHVGCLPGHSIAACNLDVRPAQLWTTHPGQPAAEPDKSDDVWRKTALL